LAVLEPKFKPGDVVVWQQKGANGELLEKKYAQIISIENNGYLYRYLPSSATHVSINFVDIEKENTLYTETRIITDEEKLEIL
jgi:NMD protein affecting ribosome stability and mRNA decay